MVEKKLEDCRIFPTKYLVTLAIAKMKRRKVWGGGGTKWWDEKQQ